MKTWIYDEFNHCGVDYSDAGQAEVYDRQHQKFRDYEKEFTELIAFLEIDDTHAKTLIDLGCGTGAISIFAARTFRQVYAVDVSRVMIETARNKPGGAAANLTFINAGFLTYEHRGEPVDLVMTKAAFHHLPDFWKQIALLRINKLLKTGGTLYIHDIVFHFDPSEYVSRVDSWISGFEKTAGKEFRIEVETHIRDEYSTFAWIMNEMLKKAGFSIEKCRSDDGFVTEYICRKIHDLPLQQAE